MWGQPPPAVRRAKLGPAAIQPAQPPTITSVTSTSGSTPVKMPHGGRMRHLKTVLFLLTLSLISTAHGAVSQPTDTPLPQKIASLQKLTAAQQAHIKMLKDTLRLQM